MASDNKFYDSWLHDAMVGNGQILVHPLTAGVNTFNYAVPSGITGSGFRLFLTTDLTTVFGAFEQIGPGSVVFVSDSNLLTNLGFPSNDNGQFLLDVAQVNIPKTSTILFLISGFLSLIGLRKMFLE